MQLATNRPPRNTVFSRRTESRANFICHTGILYKSFLGGVILLAGVASLAPAQNNLIMVNNDVDNSALVRSNGQIDLGGNNAATRRVGSSGTPDQGLAPTYLFELPSPTALAAGDAGLEISFTGFSNAAATDYNTDVYGLGYVTAPAVAANWYYGDVPLDQRTRAELGTGSTGTITRIFDDFFTPDSNPGRYETGPSAEVKTFLQSLYDDGAVAGDYAVIRMTADQIVDDSSLRDDGSGYNIGIDDNGNRPYNPAKLLVGTFANAADTFGGGTGLQNDPILTTYQTGYGFAGPWQQPDDTFAARATIGRPTFHEPDQPEPIMVTTGLGTFDGGFTGARITGDTGFTNSPLRRELDAPIQDDVYFRYIGRAEAGFDSDDLMGFWLDDSLGNESTDRTQNGVLLGIRNGGEVFGSINGTTTAAAATINEAEDNLLVGRLYEASPGSGLNTLDFWLNPDTEDDAPLGTVNLGSNGFNAVSHVGFMTTATTELEDFYLVDALAIGDSAERISFVDPVIPPGDVNGDGIADIQDYEIIRMNFFTSVTDRAEGDLTEDGFVGADDFRQWKTFRTAGSGSSLSLVPEPSTAAIAICGLAAMVYWGCRRECHAHQ